MNAIERKDYGKMTGFDGKPCYRERIWTKVDGESLECYSEVPVIEGEPHEKVAPRRAGEHLAVLEALRQEISRRIGREAEIVPANDPAGTESAWK
jgi:hypothetical protein